MITLRASLLFLVINLMFITTYAATSDNNRRYVFFGSVGAGKSTMVELIGQKLNISTYCELRDEWDAELLQFLDSTYVSPEGTEAQKTIHKELSNEKARREFAFPLQKKVLEVFNKLHPDKIKDGIFESSPLTIRWTFVELNIQKNNFTAQQIVEYAALDKKLGWDADIYFYLNTQPAQCLKRLKTRLHVGDSNYDIGYLQFLHEVNKSCFMKLKDMESEGKLKVYEIKTPNVIEDLDATAQQICNYIKILEDSKS